MKLDVIKDNYSFLTDKRNKLNIAFHSLFSGAISNRSLSNIDNFTSEDVVSIYESITNEDISTTPNMSFAAFCAEFSQLYSCKIQNVFSDDIELMNESHQQIAYLKNAFSDKAYRKFAEDFNKVSAAYYPGFREVCEEVYYERCSHAILPFYSSTDGQLPSFRKLISKYDLKIISATDVQMSDEAIMRYALLKKTIPSLSSDKKSSHLDISVVIDKRFACGSFLVACESLGATVQSVSSYPLEYADNGEVFSVVFNVSTADLTALYLFLEGSHIRYTVEGLYNII